MTAVDERTLTLTPRALAEQMLKATGQGYVQGRRDAGDLRLDDADIYAFGAFYAANHTDDLDLPELYTRFVAEHEERRTAEEDGAS